MDIMSTKDQAIATDTPRRRPRFREEHSIESLKQLLANGNVPLRERKKNDTKKLKKKLVEVEEQNESLANAINEKNVEIAELKKSVNSLNDVLNSVPLDELRSNSSIASAKLLEFSKKIRQLRVELETTKCRLNKKDIHIQKLERDLKLAQEKNQQQGHDTLKRQGTLTVDELQTKCSALQQKLFETRNKNAELQNQLKLAQKCLQQEIGENFNLNLLASHSTTANWRGRAQQIIHLQQKVQELKDRLEGYEQQYQQQQQQQQKQQQQFLQCHTNVKYLHNGKRNKSPMSQCEIARCPEGAIGAPSLISAFSVGSYERPAVRKSELQHRAKVEALENEINNLKSKLEEHRSKILALKVRNKTLNDEISRYKMKATSLEEQTDCNSTNMALMNEQMNYQKNQYEKRIEDLKLEKSQLRKQLEDLEIKEGNARLQIENYKMDLNRKDEQMANAKTSIKKLENDLKALCRGFLFSCRELRKVKKEEFIAILDTLEAEKDSLMQRNQKLNERIEEERQKNENLQDLMAKQKTRIARLEAKIRDIEKDIETQNKRRKRVQRINDYAMSLNSVPSATTIGSITFENSSYTGSLKNDVDDLKNRLELSQEKVAMLKEKLDYITIEKQNDMKTFDQIIKNSKFMILETILSQRGVNSDNDSNNNECNGSVNIHVRDDGGGEPSTLNCISASEL